MAQRMSGAALPGPGAGPTLEQFAPRYLEWSGTNKRPASHERDCWSMQRILEQLGSKRMAELKAEHVEVYKAARRTRVGPATVNLELALLQHMFTQARRWGIVKEHPLRGLVEGFKVRNQVVRYLSREEEDLLLTHAPGWMRHAILVAVNSGLRLEEELSLGWGDVSFSEGLLCVRDGKGGKSRHVPLNQTLRKLLQGMSRSTQSGFLFVNGKTGTRYTRHGVGCVFRRVVEKAGVKHVRWHDLRHTFASRLVQAGVSLLQLKELLGHATLAMVQRYAHLAPENLASAVRVLDRGYGVQSGVQSLGGY